MTRSTHHQDAFGRALYEHCQGSGTEVFLERDDGMLESHFRERCPYLEEYPQWAVHEQRAIRLVRGRVLDIGCGAGRVAIYLQEQGFEVLGIDVSPLAVKTCKLRGVKQARLMSIEDLGLRAGIFDTVLMYGNGFGLLGAPARARRLLARLWRMTSSQGRILASAIDPYHARDHNDLAYRRQNRKRGRLPGQVRIRVRYQTDATPWFEVLLVSKIEMARIIDDTGWKVVRFLSSEGPAYLAVLEKDQQ